jgi:hypothetical protein
MIARPALPDPKGKSADVDHEEVLLATRCMLLPDSSFSRSRQEFSPHPTPNSSLTQHWLAETQIG